MSHYGKEDQQLPELQRETILSRLREVTLPLYIVLLRHICVQCWPP